MWIPLTDRPPLLPFAKMDSGEHDLAARDVSSSVITGYNPTVLDTHNPIILFIIQLFIILVFTQGLAYPLSFLRQPKVIAEVIGGILLGPTALGRIPGFSAAIFPTASLSYLNLVANIGLILFLFQIGLEVDLGVMKRNGRNSALISIAGMVIPFGLGSAVAVPVYHNFVDTTNVSFGHFVLFAGVAMAITAFPVLCRILSATKLLDTRVGVIVLAAGAGNDVVGWVLLALTLALVNAQAGVTALYVLLTAVGWTVILLWPIKKAFRWLAFRTGSMDGHGPTPGMMLLTLLIVFASAFVTGVIGVHPIFGAFLAGIIIPHDGGFAISLTMKIEDIVEMLFLPIYFVLSGLSTNLGLLKDGKDWGYIVLICVVAWIGKFGGCASVAKCLKYSTRESAAIGMLMSCKGLVELIVLNVGLQAGIIDTRLFSMFVVEAVVLTFITTPCTLWIYPMKHRERATTDVQKRARTDPEKRTAGLKHVIGASGGRETTTKLLVVLQKIEHLSAVMFLSQLLEPTLKVRKAPALTAAKPSSSGKNSDSEDSRASSPSHGHSEDGPSGIHMDALKIIELTGRTFSVMQSAEKDQILLHDDALQLFKQFGRLRGLDVAPHLSIVALDSYPAAVAEHAEELGSEMVLLPWTIPVVSGSSALIDAAPATAEIEGLPSSSLSPYESIFGADSQGSPVYTTFLRRVFAECPADIALFVDRGFGSSSAFAPGSGQHIFLPFFGGPDDRLALRLVVQLCQHPNVTATVARIDSQGSGFEGGASLEVSESEKAHTDALHNNQLTLGTGHNSQGNRIASETADALAWDYFSSPSSARADSTEAAIKRINFTTSISTSPLHRTLELAAGSFRGQGTMWRPLLIVTGRGRKGARINHGGELTKLLADKGQNPSVGAELRKTVGDAATGLMLAGGEASTASFLVLEAGGGSAA